MSTPQQPSSSPLFYSSDALRDLSLKIIQMAKDLGATDAASEVSESSGLSVSVRRQAIETLERTRDRAASVTVYSGLKRGHATTSDFSDQALKDAVAKALDIARYTAEDPCAGLPEEQVIARNIPALDLYFPWEVSAESAVGLAMSAEKAALSVSPAIKNTEGASVAANHGQFFAANTKGFSGGYPYSRHWLSVAPIAQQGDAMQRDDWYTSDRDPRKLADPESVGRYAAQRALARLNARKISTQRVPVLFEAPLASGLLGAFVQAVSGGALYRKSSFLLDSLRQGCLSPNTFILLKTH